MEPPPKLPALLSSVLALGLLAVIIASCGGDSSSPTPRPRLVDTPSSANAAASAIQGESGPAAGNGALALVKLPADEGAHNAGIEWWYFNGHLADDLAQGYSFHFVTFQTGGNSPQASQAGQLLQLSWGDHAGGTYLTAEKLNLRAAEAVPGSFAVRSAGWFMSGNGSDYALAFDVGMYSVELQAASRKPAALHQGTGLVSLGPAGDTYYYTQPRLELSGILTVDGQPRRVSGIGWMDHQWGEFASRRVGWDWMSLQLDDGSELMAALVWDPDGRQPFASYGTFISSDGAARRLGEGEIRLTSVGSWTSSTTGTVYPMGWELSVTPLRLRLILTPVHQDSEFPRSRYGPPAYWEGAVSLAGEVGGSLATGRGFVELVGYGH